MRACALAIQTLDDGRCCGLASGIRSSACINHGATNHVATASSATMTNQWIHPTPTHNGSMKLRVIRVADASRPQARATAPGSASNAISARVSPSNKA